jgi:hypothetical protein
MCANGVFRAERLCTFVAHIGRKDKCGPIVILGVTRHVNTNETSIAAVLAPYEHALNRLDADTVMKLCSPDGVFLPQYFPSSVGADAVCNNMPAPVELNQWKATCIQTFPGGNGPDWKKFHCATQKSYRNSRMAVVATSRMR